MLYSRDAYISLSLRSTYSILARLDKKGLGQQAGVCFIYLTPVLRIKNLIYSLEINKIATETLSGFSSRILAGCLNKPILPKNNYDDFR